MATATADQQTEDTAGAVDPQERQQAEGNGAALPQRKAAQQPAGSHQAAQRSAWASQSIILGSQSASRRGSCWLDTRSILQVFQPLATLQCQLLQRTGAKPCSLLQR
jgi:hypothetical protein